MVGLKLGRVDGDDVTCACHFLDNSEWKGSGTVGIHVAGEAVFIFNFAANGKHHTLQRVDGAVGLGEELGSVKEE